MTCVIKLNKHMSFSIIMYKQIIFHLHLITACYNNNNSNNNNTYSKSRIQTSLID